MSKFGLHQPSARPNFLRCLAASAASLVDARHPKLVVFLLLAAASIPAWTQNVVLLPATIPASASPSGAGSSLYGSGFPAGLVDPAAIEIRLTPQANPQAPPIVIPPEAVLTTFQTQKQIVFRLPSTLAVTDSAAYFVAVSGPGVASGNSAQLIVNPPASVQSLDRTSLQAGQSATVQITGRFTNFTPGATTASFGTGIQVGGAAAGEFGPVTVTGPTTALAQVVVDSSAAPGARSLSVRTGTEIASAASLFSVVGGTPAILSLSPAATLQGVTGVPVEIIGQFTAWSASTAVSFGSGITVRNLSATSATRLTALLDVDLLAATGDRTVTVTTGAQVLTRPAAFRVNLGPKITQVNPGVGQRGVANLNVQISGEATNWAQGQTTVSFGAGITVGTVTVTTPLLLTASISIDPAAPLGGRSVSVTTGASIQSAANAFTVESVSGSVTGIVTSSLGQPAGATVYLYSVNPFIRIQQSIASPATGQFSFANVPAGDLRLYALTSNPGEIAFATSAVSAPNQTVVANLQLSATGSVVVEVKDSLGTPVANSGVELTLRNIPIPPDFTGGPFRRPATTNANGEAQFAAVPALSVQASAIHPTNNSTGAAIGIVPSDGTLTLPVGLTATGFNETFSALVSLRNGPPPSAILPLGFNDVSSALISLRNGPAIGPPIPDGLNDVSSALISLRNGPPPSNVLPTGFNDTATALISLRNGPPPSNVLPTGFNDTATALISLRNGPPVTTLPSGLSETLALPLVLRNGAVLPNAEITQSSIGRPDRLLVGANSESSESTIAAGDTLSLRYDAPPGTDSVEFWANGARLARQTEAPFEEALVVPDVRNPLQIRVLARSESGVLVGDVTKTWSVIPVSERAVEITNPVKPFTPNSEVWTRRPGLIAELFDFQQPQASLPDLAGRTPDRTVTLSSINFHSPDGEFAYESFGSGNSPDFGARLLGYLQVDEAGSYRFAIAARDAARLWVNDREIAGSSTVDLIAGRHPVRLEYHAGVLNRELQILWAHSERPLRPIPASRWSHDRPAMTDSEGKLIIPATPVWMKGIVAFDLPPGDSSRPTRTPMLSKTTENSNP